ncbi:MAG: hypothetical protein RI894_1796 [Bacteroidota bacterium]|jgi:hypothetical protein
MPTFAAAIAAKLKPSVLKIQKNKNISACGKINTVIITPERPI